MSKEEFINWIGELNENEYSDVLVKLGLIDPKDKIDEIFEEFLKVFPEKTPSGRILRPKNATAKQNKLARAIFKKELKKSTSANIALVGLKQEIQARQQQGSLEYMQNLLAYIRGNNWDNYYDPDAETPDIDLDQASSAFLF